jgi:predicted nucleotidyltransferase
VSGEERATAPATDAHAAAAEAFADRVRDRFGDAVARLYVFGSTARDAARGLASDVDVLVVLADAPIIRLSTTRSTTSRTT